MLLGLLASRERATQLGANTPTRLRRRTPWANVMLWLGTTVIVGLILASLPGSWITVGDRAPDRAIQLAQSVLWDIMT
jgi:hypothetical protein